MRIPMTGWSSDPKWKEVGQFYALATEEGIEGYCVYLLTEVVKWEYAEMQALVAKARKALRDKSLHVYVEM